MRAFYCRAAGGKEVATGIALYGASKFSVDLDLSCLYIRLQGVGKHWHTLSAVVWSAAGADQ